MIGTTATINSNIYKTKINTLQNDINVSSLATPLLASLIEENSKGIIWPGDPKSLSFGSFVGI